MSAEGVRAVKVARLRLGYQEIANCLALPEGIEIEGHQFVNEYRCLDLILKGDPLPVEDTPEGYCCPDVKLRQDAEFFCRPPAIIELYERNARRDMYERLKQEFETGQRK